MAWWQRPRVETLSIRLAGPTDRPALADLLARAARQFGSQAVEDQMTLLNSGASSLALSGNRAAGFLGLRLRTPSGHERWADLGLAALASSWTADRAIRALLASSLPRLAAQGVTGIVCLLSGTWLYNPLLEAGFRESDRVITYIRNDRPIAVHNGPSARLRPAGPAEAQTMLHLNEAAFAPLWRYDDATTLSWLLTSEHAVLAEREGGPAGFCLTSRAASDGYAQLIRLATHPQWQGQGIGRQMVVDAINFGHRTGALGVALNTQFSNSVSRHLYESLGFRNVGPPVDVLVYNIK
jgi:putative acetyltransferase